MKAKRLRWVTFLLLGLLPAATAARAQEDVVAAEPEAEPVVEDPAAPAEERPETRFMFEIGYLGATTVGGDLRVGTEFDAEESFYRTLYLPQDMASGGLYRLGWRLPEDSGEIVARYWSQTANVSTVLSRPGEFVFGITETIPFLHGIADDGLADAIEAVASFRNRDADLVWRFPVVERPRFRMHLSSGIRLLIHRQDSSIAYYALDPGIPSLIEPGGGDLASLLGPIPDRAATLTEFRGNGLQIGADAVVPLVGDRLQLEASAGIALLRGTTRSSYSTSTSAYVFLGVFLITFDEFLELLEAGFSGSLSQATFQLAIENPGRSTTATALDISLGLRSRVWRGIEVALGARLTRYEDIVYDLRPTQPGLTPLGRFTFGGVEETWRSIGYEAFYATAAYRF